MLTGLRGGRRATYASATAPEHVPDGRRRGRVLDRGPARRTRSWSRRASSGVPVLHRAGVLRRDRGDAPTRSRSPDRTARRRPRRCSRSSCGERAGNPSFVIGGEVNEVGTNAAYGDGEWLVVEADESDGTFLQLAPEAAIVTNVEPDHLDHYGGFDAARRARSSASSTRCRARSSAAPTTRSAPRSPRAGRASAPTVTHADADYRIVDYRRRPDGARFTLVARRRTLGELVVPLGGQGRDERDRRGGDGARARRRVRRRRRARCAASAASPAASSTAASATASTFVDDYAHLPAEVAAAIATARESWLGRVIVVFQPHRYSRTASPVARLRRRVRRRRHGRAHRRVRGGRDTDRRASAVGSSCTPSSIAIPTLAGLVPRRARATCSTLPARVARPGDVVLTLGAGDLTTMPDAWLGREPRRRDGSRSTHRRRARRAPSRARCDRDASSAALTTYRCGGPLAVLVRGRRRGRLAASSPTCSRPTECRVLVVGRGSNLLVADAGFAGVALALGRRRSSSSTSTTAPPHVVRRAARLPSRCSPAGRRRPGVGGLEFFVGIPGSVGGAVRMNAGGHGATPTTCSSHARVGSISPTARPARSRSTELGLGYRRSALGAACGRARRDVRRPTRRPGGVRRTHRRDRALAPGAPARRPERGLGVHQPAGRRGRPPHRGVRLQGPADRRRRRVREARQLLRRRARRGGRRRLRARRARCSGVVAGGDRRPPRARAPPRRFAVARSRAMTRRRSIPRIRERRIEVQREAGRAPAPDHAARGRARSSRSGSRTSRSQSPLLDVDHVRVARARRT